MEFLEQDQVYNLNLKENISKPKGHIHQLTIERFRLKEELNAKREIVCEKGVALQVLKVREKVFLEKKRELEKEKMKLEKETKDLKRQYIQETDKLCKLMVKFNKQYKMKNVLKEQNANTIKDLFGFDLSCIFPEKKPILTSTPKEDISGEIFTDKSESNGYMDGVSKGILDVSFDIDF